jgi:hypothetical protein
MMVAIAIIAVISGGFIQVRKWRRLSIAYGRKASEYAVAAQFDGMDAARAEAYLTRIQERMASTTDPSHVAMLRQMEGEKIRDSESGRRSSEYLSRLVIKYQHAARYPWLPVEPDPPRPE